MTDPRRSAVGGRRRSNKSYPASASQYHREILAMANSDNKDMSTLSQPIKRQMKINLILIKARVHISLSKEFVITEQDKENYILFLSNLSMLFEHSLKCERYKEFIRPSIRNSIFITIL